MDSRARNGLVAATPLPASADQFQQHVAAIDDLLLQAVDAARAECRLAPAFFTQLNALLQCSEAMRVASRLADGRALDRCVRSFEVAARQTFELARRAGRCSKDLLTLLQILTHLVVELGKRVHG